MKNYDDIIDLPHHVSDSHPHMPVADRAAQFAPFAALTGYGDIIDEAGRFTEEKEEPDEARLAELDETLRTVLERGGRASIVYFEEDARKQGGAYKVYTGTIARADGIFRRLVMKDGTAIDFENVIGIEPEEE